MADQGAEYYRNFSEPVRNYMESRGSNAAGLMRILQRLGLPLPPSPNEGHGYIAGFLDEHGEEEFLLRMGQLRQPSQVTPSPDVAPVALKWKKKMSPASRLTVETVGELRSGPDMQRTPEAPMLPPDSPSTESMAEFVLDLEDEVEEEHDEHLPVQKAQPRPQETGPAPPTRTELASGNTHPELKGIPKAAITDEVQKVIAAGGNPFGPPPLIDRRSGLDRRCGQDRRGSTELVFRNQRYGPDRRDGEERRAVSPPYRDRSIPMEECVGNPELKRMGWVPPALEREEAESEENN